MLLCQPEVASHSASDVLWPPLSLSALAASMASSVAERMASPPPSSSPGAEARGDGGAGEMFRALLNASDDVFAVISTENGFLYLSPSVHRLLGFEPSELLGCVASMTCSRRLS